MGYNQSNSFNLDFFGGTHNVGPRYWEFSMSKLELNVWLAPRGLGIIWGIEYYRISNTQYLILWVWIRFLPVRRQLDSNELQYPIFEMLNRWSWVVVGLVAFVELLTYRHRLVRHYHCSKLFLPSFRVYHSNFHVRLKNVFNNGCRKFFIWYGQYDMDHFIWFISYGLYDLSHIISTM